MKIGRYNHIVDILREIIILSNAFRSLETLLSGDEYFNSEEENTRMLENILISVISLVVVLVVILVVIHFVPQSKLVAAT